MEKLAAVLHFLTAAVVRAFTGLSLTAISTAVGVAQVLTNENAPGDWLSLTGLQSWFQADPQGAGLLVLTGIGTAAGLGLSMFQVFFSKAARRDAASIRSRIAEAERVVLARFDDQDAKSETELNKFKDEILDGVAAMLRDAGHLASDAGAVPDAQVQAAQAEAARLIASSNDPLDAATRRAVDSGDVDQTIAALLDAAAQDARSAARNYRSAALFAYGRDADQAIRAFREAVHLEPGDVWGHIFLSRLYASRGDGDAAIQSARAAVSAATDRRDKSCALNELGDCLRTRGGLPAARTAYEDSLAIAKALAEQDPKNTDWRRDLSVSYERAGDVCEAAGDVAEAVRLYELSEPIAAALAALAPTHAGFQNDLRITRARLEVLRERLG